MAIKYIVIILVVAVAVTLVAVFLTPSEPVTDNAVLTALSADSLKPPADTKALRRELTLLQRDLKRLSPREPYIVINTHASRLTYRTADSILFEAVCSAGSGAELIDSTSGRKWKFDTPLGMYKVTSKIKDPWWRKPDWAFIEENEPVPDDPQERLDPNVMGAFAIGFGDGYFIHGTLYERLLGVNVTHGCVRLGAKDLTWLYDKVRMGTKIYVF